MTEEDRCTCETLRILCLDAIGESCSGLNEALMEKGPFDMVSVTRSDDFWKVLSVMHPHVVLLNVGSSELGVEGLRLVRRLRSDKPQIVILWRSPCDDFHSLRRCLCSGIDDFLSPRCSPSETALRITNAVAAVRLKRAAATAAPEVSSSRRIPHIAGRTMQEIGARIPCIMASAVRAVHVMGESGTGKEVVADLLGAYSHPRPLLRVNCGALCCNLIESELFGHAKGSFTGAATDRRGFFEEASEGWLFLDEVSSLSPSAQIALLRALDTGEIFRVGETRPRPARVRILSATNEPLERLVREGRFRCDLWQRLREVEIILPALRDRPDEIPELISHFCASMEGGPYEITSEATDVLCSYPWRDGNIRELRNCLRAMTTLQVNKTLSLASVPERIWRESSEASSTGKAGAELPDGHDLERVLAFLGAPKEFSPSSPLEFELLVDRLFLALIRSLLTRSERCSLRALAQALGVSHPTVQRRLRALGIQGLLSSEEGQRIS